MATLAETVKSMLEDDSQLATLLPGGFFDAEDLDVSGESDADAPKLAGGVLIEPHAVIRWGESTAYSAEAIEAEVGNVEIYVYQQRGHATIDSAQTRIKQVLNRQLFFTDDRALVKLSLAMVSREIPAEEFGGASCKFSRYAVYQIRR